MLPSILSLRYPALIRLPHDEKLAGVVKIESEDEGDDGEESGADKAE